MGSVCPSAVRRRLSASLGTYHFRCWERLLDLNLSTKSTVVLGMEVAAIHSRPPIGTVLLSLSSSQDHPQFKDGTDYRQIRPTRRTKSRTFKFRFVLDLLQYVKRAHTLDIGD